MRSLRAVVIFSCLSGCSTGEGESAPVADASTDTQATDTSTDTKTTDAAPTDTTTASDTTVADTPAADTRLDGSATDSAIAQPGDVGTDTKPLGAPITAPKEQWTWVDFADSTCDDGTKTGLGVNLTDKSSNVLVYQTGGGGCWDALTCFTLRTATGGPFGAAQFATVAANANSAIFDRTDTANPFKDWSFVYVPYCTGDWHAGDNVASYVVSGETKTYHHEGRKNVRAYLARLGATFTAPTKVVVAGSSAGGFGALLDYDLYRGAWPSTKAYLLADSGPFLQKDDFSPTLRGQMYANWRLDKFLGTSCPTCQTDLSALVKARVATYPNDRIALLSTTQDSVLRSTFGLTATSFETALLALGADVYAPTAQARFFFAAGTQHTLLFTWTQLVSGGIDAKTWVRRFVEDDASWASIKP